MANRLGTVDTLRFDTRLIDYNLRNRVLTLEEYESYLKTLPDEPEHTFTPVFEETPPSASEGATSTPAKDTPDSTESH
jgi:hypothetical protein